MKRCLFAATALSLLSCPALVAAADTYTQTRYPIVLVHGLMGFDALGPFEYFYGLPGELRRSGAVVYAPNVSQANSNEVRGEQLLLELQMLKARYGHSKFNLIGHSHGGATIRYVAAVAPDLVASVTSIGAPHQGSVIGDKLHGFADATGTTGFLAGLVNAFASVVAYLSGKPANPQDSLGALQSLSTPGAKEFNVRFPQGAPTSACGEGPEVVNGVRYYSMSGTAPFTNPFDLFDYGLLIGSTLLDGEPSDGLVTRCSSRWGKVLRDNYEWNHGDEVNQTFGLRGIFSSDPVAVYRAHANRLKLLGL